jgi:catechol 2,3-dioxygenase-like lactoylglutathione lyase family enzyme
MARLADSIRKGVPMISVPDVAVTLDWYASIGFRELERHEEDGVVDLGKAESGPHDVSLWFYTDRVDELYQLLKSRQLEFAEEIYDTFYGAREFGIRDLNEYALYFIQPLAGAL